jgi:hypothetical protein
VLASRSAHSHGGTSESWPPLAQLRVRGPIIRTFSESASPAGPAPASHSAKPLSDSDLGLSDSAGGPALVARRPLARADDWPGGAGPAQARRRHSETGRAGQPPPPHPPARVG